MNRNRLIEKYLDGELSQQMVEKVHCLIKKDPAFAKELQLREEVNNAILDDGPEALCDSLRTILKPVF